MRMSGMKDAEAGFTTRILFALLKWRTGKVPAPLRVYAHKPGIMRGFLTLARRVRGVGALPERLKRLAMYWTAHRVECPF